MRIEVKITTTEGPSGHYRGEVTLTPQDIDVRSMQFTFTLTEENNKDRKLIVRRGDRVYIEVQGEKREGHLALKNLTDDQLALIKLIGPGLSKTLYKIAAEGGGGRPEGELLANQYKQLGMSFEIVAEDTSVLEINDPVEQSHALQMLEDDS